MLNYLKKFAMDILPSVAATIIGAYIVNHYIATKPGARCPGRRRGIDRRPKSCRRQAGRKVRRGREPARGRRQGEGNLRKSHDGEDRLRAADGGRKGAEKSLRQNLTQAADVKPADAPAETASIPADPRRHAPAPRDKVRVILPSPVQAVTPTVAPAAAAPVPAPPVETAFAAG